jgi:hypothetical protein
MIRSVLGAASLLACLSALSPAARGSSPEHRSSDYPSYDLIRCGVLEDLHIPGEPCVLFVSGSFAAPLDDYGGFGDGDTVLVYGTYDYPSPLGCGGYGNGIRVKLIQECRNFDWGCGTLWHYEDEARCAGFHSWRYGDFFLSDFGGFQVGDTVQVYGGWKGVLTWCAVDGEILVDSVTACTDTLTAVSPTTWGWLKALFR